MVRTRLRWWWWLWWWWWENFHVYIYTYIIQWNGKVWNGISSPLDHPRLVWLAYQASTNLKSHFQEPNHNCQAILSHIVKNPTTALGWLVVGETWPTLSIFSLMRLTHPCELALGQAGHAFCPALLWSAEHFGAKRVSHAFEKFCIKNFFQVLLKKKRKRKVHAIAPYHY